MMPDFDAYNEGLRLQHLESIASSANKITHESLVIEVEELGRKLRALLPVTKDNWPEFNGICSTLRGICFRAFSLSSSLYRVERTTVLIKPKPATIDDIFGAL